MRSMEFVLFAAAAVFQLAAMIFALLMTRIRTKQRPWQILFLALLLMFVFRVIHVISVERGWPPVGGKITSAAALLISILIFASLFSIRKLALAERMAERMTRESEERERAARMLAESQGRIKDEFLATLSHELRTPLNAIVGWTDLIRRSTDDRQTVVEGIEVIHRNAQAQTRLIDDLLDMSRIISGKMRLDIQQIHPGPVIDAAIEATNPAAQAKGVRIRKVLDPLAGPVSGDPGRLGQIIWNLLSNAIKFTPRGGVVEVLLERVNSHVEISVADNGEGIPPEFLPFVFERFRQADSSTTRKHFGLGLGLAISKNLVELHGGQIRATSAGTGKGATFTVSLPIRIANLAEVDRSHPAAANKSPAGEPLETELQGIAVLVVDDDADARELIARLLQARRATVSVASSAEEAHKLIALGDPDVIVSDIGMPGQDGYQFIRELRRGGVRTPAIALTAFARSEDRMRALQAGYQMHLAKPVQPAELITVVGSVTGRLLPDTEVFVEISGNFVPPAG